MAKSIGYLFLHITDLIQNCSKHFKILGISYKKYESLCQAKIDAKIQGEETRARDDEIKKLCPYVDCNSQQAKYICTEECIGSK